MRHSWVLLLVLACAPLGAQAQWTESDALGKTSGLAAPAGKSRGWILKTERTGTQEARTLFHDGEEDSLRLVDFDAAGRTLRIRDLRAGAVVWDVAYDPDSGLPRSETTFEGDEVAEVAVLRFEAGLLTKRVVSDASGDLLYTDTLRHWPDGTLRRLERDGPDGPLAEAAWSYGPGSKLAGAWSVSEDERSRGEHKEWLYSSSRTEERWESEAGLLQTRVTEWLEKGGSKETKTDATSLRTEVRTTDPKGRTLEEVVTVKSVVVQTRRWSYDDQGRVVETTVESAGPTEVWTYRYEGGDTAAVLTRDGVVVREEHSHDGERTSVRLYDRGQLFLEETWSEGRRTKETYYQNGTLVRERVP